jgi:tetratricopeptide (TPR) repeat protein
MVAIWVSVAAFAMAAAPVAAQRTLVTAPVAMLETRARADSNDPVAQYDLGVAYFAQGRMADAERRLRTAVLLRPRFAEAWLALSRVVPDDSLVATRDAMVRRALLIDPLVDLRILGGTVGADADPAIRELLEGAYQASAARLTQAIAAAGGRAGASVALLSLRAMAAARAGDLETAIDDLRAMLVRSRAAAPEGERYLPLLGAGSEYDLAVLYQRAGRLDAALAAFTASLEEDIGNYMAHVHLAELYEHQRSWDAAIRERQAAADLAPEDATLQMDLGATLGKAGRIVAAADALRRAATANPRDARAEYWLGRAELQLGHADSARAAFTRFVAQASGRDHPQVLDARIQLDRLR